MHMVSRWAEENVMRTMTVAEQSLHFLSRQHPGMPTAPIANASAWCPADLGPMDEYTERLSPDQIAAFEAAISHARNSGKAPAALNPEDFPLGEAGSTVKRWKEQILQGKGFMLVRGFPVERWSRDDQHLFIGGLGVHFGHLGLQNPQGDVIAEVRNTGAAARNPAARNYITDREFRLHCDAADMLGLLSISKAATGGTSHLASSTNVFNQLLAMRPDLAARLFEPVLLDLMDEQPEGYAPFTPIMPSAFDGEIVRTFYISDYLAAWNGMTVLKSNRRFGNFSTHTRKLPVHPRSG